MIPHSKVIIFPSGAKSLVMFFMINYLSGEFATRPNIVLVTLFLNHCVPVNKI